MGFNLHNAHAVRKNFDIQSVIFLVCLSLLTMGLAGCSGINLSKAPAAAATSTDASAPSIVTQPANASVTAGQTALFTVNAAGTAALTYQWQNNSNPIAGATSATYTTTAVTMADTGSTQAVA